ncbi:hypothetical protein ACQKCY_11015, partial [Escherichia coli]
MYRPESPAGQSRHQQIGVPGTGHQYCQRQDYWPFWGCGRFPGLSGDKTCLLKKKKSAPLSFISNMVR